MISGVNSSSSSPRLSTRNSRRAHDAERAVEIGLQRVAVEGVVAHAEEGEIVGQQPLQELDRLGDLVDRQRRRIGLEIGDDAVDALEHGAPVLHRQPHFAEHARERAHDLGARGLVLDRLDMDMDEAFARAAGGVGGAERDELCAVAPHAEDRMRHQLHVEPALGELAHHRIDQERHVVVDDLDHRDRLALARLFQRHGLAADFRRARLPVFEKIERPLGQLGEIGGARSTARPPPPRGRRAARRTWPGCRCGARRARRRPAR